MDSVNLRFDGFSGFNGSNNIEWKKQVASSLGEYEEQSMKWRFTKTKMSTTNSLNGDWIIKWRQNQIQNQIQIKVVAWIYEYAFVHLCVRCGSQMLTKQRQHVWLCLHVRYGLSGPVRSGRCKQLATIVQAQHRRVFRRRTGLGSLKKGTSPDTEEFNL